MFGRAWAGWALAAAALCVSGPARAQTPGPLALVCRGADLQMAMPRMSGSGMKMTQMNTPRGMSGTVKPEKHRAQVNVVVEGATARIWLSDGLLPAMTRKSADGWYALSDVEVDVAVIRGKAPFGAMIGARTGLQIDRTNGKVSLGSFEGVCHPAMLGPGVTRF